MRRKTAIILLIILSLTTSAYKCSPEQQQTFKKQAVSKVDTLANSIKLATGITKDLYNAHKITRETAEKWATALSKANDKGKWLGSKIKSLDANSTQLPSDLTGVLDEIESLLKSFGVGSQYVEMVRAVADAVGAVNDLRKLVQ